MKASAQSHTRVTTQCHREVLSVAQTQVWIVHSWGFTQDPYSASPQSTCQCSVCLCGLLLSISLCELFLTEFFRLFISRPAALLEANTAARER